jgi:hypothetical protein
MEVQLVADTTVRITNVKLAQPKLLWLLLDQRTMVALNYKPSRMLSSVRVMHIKELP